MNKRDALDRTDHVCSAIKQHVRRRDRAGIIVLLIDDNGESVATALHSVNTSRFSLRCAAIDLLATYQSSLIGCSCGTDHSREIAELGVTLSTLQPAAGGLH